MINKDDISIDDIVTIRGRVFALTDRYVIYHIKGVSYTIDYSRIHSVETQIKAGDIVNERNIWFGAEGHEKDKEYYDIELTVHHIDNDVAFLSQSVHYEPGIAYSIKKIKDLRKVNKIKG